MRQSSPATSSQRDAANSKQAGARCQIKGNISAKGDHIYHMPGGEFYERTRINLSKGERWFCIEAAVEPHLQAVEVIGEVAETERGLLQRRVDRWRDDLADEACKCRLVAEAEKIDRSFVSRLLSLTLLVPDIQEAFIDGGQLNVLQLEELTLVMPAIWGEQRQSCVRCLASETRDGSRRFQHG